MKGWSELLGGGKSLPPAPPEEVTARSLEKADGRSARATGRRKQFNPRVREDFKVAFEEEVRAEEERTGEKVTHGRLLELMLAGWRMDRAAGKPAPPLGIVLPDTMLKAADALAAHLRCSREAAVYLSLSPSFFRKLVADKKMPRPRLVGGRRIWDVEELDLAFKALPREGGEGEPIFTEDGDSWADFK